MATRQVSIRNAVRDRLARLLATTAPSTTPPAAPAVGDTAKFARELAPGTLAQDRASVTRLLYGRLDGHDADEVERVVRESGDSALTVDPTEGPLRWWHVLALGTWFRVPVVAEKTGLVVAQPPEDVHSMARGPLNAAGGLYEADLVVDAMASVGMEMEGIRSALDFGCSSGRVVRVLAAAYPEIDWFGCDPNERAIGWARENLRAIQFSVSHNDPPLPFRDGSLDLAYAISIWSHFEPALGIRWFEEMHRVIRPGGHLVCTTHGVTSIAFNVVHRHRTAEQADQIAVALYRRGWWYAPEFGEQGDWGVVNPAWGTAFLSPEWLLMELCPRWRLLEFAPGRNQANQDVYVFQRAG
jgi:SAM-dependent methyltransferase